MKKRVVSLFLTLVMVLGMFPTVAFATGSANVAQIGNQGYATLADAIAAANAGDTITFVADITENVTINKSVTIDGAGKTYTGHMELTERADITIKNVNFDGKGYNGYAVEPRGAYYVTIEDCTAKNYGYGFMQIASATVLTTVKNVTVSNMNYGVKVDSGMGNAIVLENVDIDVAAAALLNSNTGEKTIKIKNSRLSILGTWARNNTVKTTYVFEGANTVDEFIIEPALDNFKLAADATLTAPNDITVTTDVADHEVVYENGVYFLSEAKTAIAKIGKVEYYSLQEAVNAAKHAQTITLLGDAEGPGVVIDKKDMNIVIDFNGYTYTLTEPVGSKGTESNGFQILSGAKLVTLNNGTLKVADDAADKFYILIQNYANLTVRGMTLDGTNLDKWSKTDGDSYVLSNNSGKVTITTTTAKPAVTTSIITNNDGDKAFAFDSCDKSDWGYTLPTVTAVSSVTINGDKVAQAGDKIEAAAKIGTVYYATLQQAFDAAASGQTVTLMKNIEVDWNNVIKTSENYTVLFNVEGKSLTLNMNGKKISVDHLSTTDRIYAVINVEDGASLKVTGNGSIDVKTHAETPKVAYMFWKRGTTGSLTIENGTYHMNNSEDSMVYTNGSDIVNVKGGTWTLDAVGTRVNRFPCIFNAHGNNSRNINVSGGTYNDNVAKQYWVYEVDIVDAKGNLSYVIDNGDGTWTVSGETAEAAIVKMVNDYEHLTGYATFKDAVTAIAKNAPETTIKLLKNITVKGQFIGHSYAQDVVIDLNGYTMSSTDKTLTVYRGGTEVTIKNGTVSGNTTGGTIQVTYGGKLTLGENVTVKSGGSANAIKVDANSTLVIDQDTTYVLGGKNDLIVADGAKVEISAGYFKHPVQEAWCAEGYVPTEKLENDYYSVMKDPAIGKAAKIGNTYYDTLGAAIEAAGNGDIITVVNNIDLANETPVLLDNAYNTYFKVEGKEVTIDLNGKTISGAYTATDKMMVGLFSTENDGKLTLTGNGTVNVTATGKVYSLIASYEPGCSIVIENGTYTLDAASDSLIYSGGASGIVTVNGGTFTLGNVATGANGSPWIFNAYHKNAYYIVVNGGTFNDDVNHQFWANEVMVPETLALKDNGDGTWTVVDAAAYVVELGVSQHSKERKVGYATLEEAAKAAKQHNTKIVLLNGVTVSTMDDLYNALILEDNVAVEGEIALDYFVGAGDRQEKTVFLNSAKLTVADSWSGPAFYAYRGGTLNVGGEGTVSVNKNFAAFITESGKMTVNGGTYQMGETNEKGHWFVQNSGVLVINEGTFISTDGNTPIAYCINGFIEINGGFFQNTANPSAALLSMGNNLNYINNQKITLRGGTFVNWNPMNSAFAMDWPQCPALIVLADGYEMISETQANGDVWYTVVAK